MIRGVTTQSVPWEWFFQLNAGSLSEKREMIQHPICSSWASRARCKQHKWNSEALFPLFTEPEPRPQGSPRPRPEAELGLTALLTLAAARCFLPAPSSDLEPRPLVLVV